MLHNNHKFLIFSSSLIVELDYGMVYMNKMIEQQIYILNSRFKYFGTLIFSIRMDLSKSFYFSTSFKGSS